MNNTLTKLRNLPINISAFATYIGINPSLLRQYVNDITKPSQKQSERIREGMREVAEEILLYLKVEEISKN